MHNHDVLSFDAFSQRHVSRCLKFMSPAIWLHTRQVFGEHKKCKQKPFLLSLEIQLRNERMFR